MWGTQSHDCLVVFTVLLSILLSLLPDIASFIGSYGKHYQNDEYPGIVNRYLRIRE